MKNCKIAITGGIGSGKTYASLALRKAGYTVFSCDEIANEIYQDESFLQELKSLFPFAVNGKTKLSADKKMIAEQVFSDKDKRQKLENLLHPLIMKKIMEEADRIEGLVFAEVPLLFEGNYQNCFDKVIVIMRSKEERINSVKLRSNLSEEQILERIACQIDYDLLDTKNYIVINNKKNTFENEVLSEVKNLEKKFKENRN